MIICDAIEARRLLHFVYDGHARTVIPAAYGAHKTTGNPTLRAYQVEGSSSSRQPPFWSLFAEAEMVEPTIGEAFEGDPPLYDPDDAHLNVICGL